MGLPRGSADDVAPAQAAGICNVTIPTGLPHPVAIAALYRRAVANIATSGTRELSMIEDAPDEGPSESQSTDVMRDLLCRYRGLDQGLDHALLGEAFRDVGHGCGHRSRRDRPVRRLACDGAASREPDRQARQGNGNRMPTLQR